MIERLQLLAGQRSNGTSVHEEVLAESQANGWYRLLKSPGLVQGLAAGDVFEAIPDGQFKIIERSGNVCVQIFSRGDLNALEQHITGNLGQLGGYLDGKSHMQLVYTVSVAGGFEAIEAAFREMTALFPDAEWYYGNVYDPTDGVTPLKWWDKA
ncbi:hypothetical protein AA309_13350 [Microvirga vignae]|uniref:DUF4265 domain-containing protein n=1 Tax=Microvirga vignae TaxID=1225564 RepID=A0A0H1RBS2_9HYPH|nr:DUF4265 domain-containing protein [Microvirga vignae]KLK92663.1 hypothetical protein AA309_13350 [Microvirga vignae]